MAAILLHLALVGCAADGVETGPETGIGTGAEASPATASKDSAAEIAAVPPAQPEKPAEPPPDLMGKQRTEIIEILGRPAFSRRDRPALLLRYRQEGCILDLFLYPAAGSNANDGAAGRAVEHIEARSADGQKMAPKTCITAVIKARMAKRQG